MEVVGSVAATLQLAQALGATVLKVREAYSQIKDIDDFLHDFDGQLDATRITLAVLHDGIGKSKFDTSTEDWWRQSELERLLRSCDQHYQRMNDIFIKIARERSSISALRSWLRTKQYDSDISHLRLCINTCINALQLPVVLHKIQTTMQVTSERPIPGEAFVLMEEVTSRLTRLESSVKDTRNDLRRRVLEQDSKGLVPTVQWSSIEKLIESLDLDLSELTSSQNHQTSSTEKGDIEVRLAQMQETISRLRIEARREGNLPHASLSLQEIREKAEMEQDTRSMLEMVDDLVGSTKDYTSTIDSLSTVSKVTSQFFTALRDGMRTSVSSNRAAPYPDTQLVPVQHFKERLENIAEWVGQNDDDGASVISRLSGLHPPPSETVATSTSQTSATSRSENNFRGEINQRRLRAVEESMEAKHYDKAIDLVERVLSDGNEPLNDEEQDRLSQFMAKAISEGKRKVDANLYIRLPLLKLRVANKECHWNLMQAKNALDRGAHDEVLTILDPSQFQFEKEWDLLGFAESEIKSVQKIQLARGQSWFYARSFWDIAAAIRVLERLLEDTNLAKADRAVAHETLARAYRRKPDYKRSKFHGEQAYQDMIDIVGRDDENLHELIHLMVMICYESEDPDRDVWKKMLPKGFPDSTWSIKRPFRAREGLDTSLASEKLRYIHGTIEKQEIRRHRSTTGIDRLQQSFLIRHCDDFFHDYDILCWECLEHYLEPHSMIDSGGVSSCRTQAFSCERHRVYKTNTRGFSLIHFFAIANRRINKDLALRLSSTITSCTFRKMRDIDPGSIFEECVDEISVLLHKAQGNSAKDLQWAKPKFIATGDFRMHDLVNRPMDLELPKGLQSFARAVVVTPVWAAALSGGRKTVSFFLSLQETEAVRGASSILLLGIRHSPRIWSNNRRHERKDVATLGVFDRVLEVFNTLPMPVARQLLSRSLQGDSHWCFVNSSFLGKVLDKCGTDSADLPVWSYERDSPKILSESLLGFFFVLMTLHDYHDGLPYVSLGDHQTMFRALLNHSRAIRRNSSFITVVIDHINDAVEGLKAPKRKIYQTTTTVRKLSLWIDLVEIYVKNNHAVGSANILKLQRCTDHLSTCKERIKQNQEEFSAISGELGEIKFLGLRRFFSESKQLRIELLEDNKCDLELEKRDLVSMVRIKEKLEGIVGSLSVERN